MMFKCYMLMNIRNIFIFTNTRETSPVLDKLIFVSHDTTNNDDNNNNNNDNKKIIMNIIIIHFIFIIIIIILIL